MRFIYILSSLLAAGTAIASAVPRAEDTDDGNTEAEIAELAPAPDVDGILPDAQDLGLYNSTLEERGIFSCAVNICKSKNQKKPCFKVNSSGRCKNLVSKDGKPFVSGAAYGGCNCVVYSKKGCPIWAGKDYGFDERGGNFPFKAQSVECSLRI